MHPLLHRGDGLRIRHAAACLLIGSFAAAAAPVAPEGESRTESSGFNLLNPTPVEHLRPMSIDGPGATESPYTVDPGHFQIEMTLFSYSSYAGPFEDVIYRLDWWSIGPLALKLGLLDHLDLQVILEPYHHVFEREGDYLRSTRSGFGDTTLRAKYNLWGNDRGSTALAVVPLVILPTSAEGVGNNHLEGGVKLPFGAELPGEFYLGLATGLQSGENVLTTGRHVEFLNSVLLARELFYDLEGYVEFASVVSTERDVGWAGTFDFGLVYWLSDNLQLNTGMNLGLTEWADDWMGFAGMAWRF